MSQPPFAPQAELVKPNSAPRSSTQAIFSLVLGVLSFFCAFFTGLPAIILGILAIGNITKRPRELKGQGLAIAGIVMGAMGCVWGLLLPALLLPAVQQVRTTARINITQNNLKQLQLSLLNAESAYKDFFSPGPHDSNPHIDQGSQLSWRVKILPFLGQQMLYDQFHHDEPWDSPHNLSLVGNMPEYLKTPGVDLEPGKTMFVVPVTKVDESGIPVTKATAFAPGTNRRLRAIADGTHSTISILHVNPDAAVTWTKPEDWVYDPNAPKRDLEGPFPGELIVVFVDGSTHRIPIEKVSDEMMRNLIEIDDGNLVQFNW